MQEKLASYIGIALKAGYVIIGADKLSTYSKKLYLVLMDKSAGKSTRKVFDGLRQKGIEGFEIENLGELNKQTYKIIGIKNLGIREQIKNQIKE